jgi:hypothetical protein
MSVKYYINQEGYFIASPLELDESKLVGVTIITDEAEAERQFKADNGMDEDDGVYIPELYEKNGVFYVTELNSCAFPIDSSPEDYINTYTV